VGSNRHPQQALLLIFVNLQWSRKDFIKACVTGTVYGNDYSFLIHISEMVRTRATDPGRTNPPPEIGGPSNNLQVTALEARIAQMSKDIQALTEQNARLLR